jgi:hypothetical protein
MSQLPLEIIIVKYKTSHTIEYISYHWQLKDLLHYRKFVQAQHHPHNIWAEGM